MRRVALPQAPLANVAEEAPARSGVALWRRRSGGTGRAGAAAKKPFVFKNWCALAWRAAAAVATLTQGCRFLQGGAGARARAACARGEDAGRRARRPPAPRQLLGHG
jgi:hypothetical protein